MNITIKVIIGVVALAGAAAAGRFTAPSKVVEKEHIVYQDKVVEKIVYVKEEATKTKKVTISFVKILPDGTKTIETKTYYSNEIQIVENQTTDKKKDVVIDKKNEKTIEFKKTDWLISLGVKTDLGFTPTYGLFVNRRILGPLYLGAFGFTDKTFGVSAGAAF